MKTLRMAVMLVLLTFAAQAVFAQSDSTCKIKGFLTKDGKKLYLVPGHKLYDKIQINTEGGEQWFCTAEEAERAGFLFVPDPNAPQIRPAASTKQTAAPTATPEPQQQAEQTVAPAEQPTPEPQPTEQAVAEQVTEQQPPVETPQEQQPAETPAQAEPESQPVDMSQPTDGEMPADAQQVFALLSLLSVMLVPVMIMIFVLSLVMIIAVWKIFTKAGKPGWAALIPIYSNIVLLEIAGMPIWWLLLEFFIFPIVWFINCLKLAQNFGKGAGYALGLFFLPFLFFPMLAFGSAEYNG